MNWYEIVGYAASVLIAFSMMMKNVLRLRIINSLGALSFVVYGLLINSLPVAGMNAFIILVNLYYIRKLYITQDAFQLIPIHYKKGNILDIFLEKHKPDIKSIFPDFEDKKVAECESYIILRNLTASGLFLYKEKNETIDIYLDYVAPEYRDFQTSEYLYNDKVKIFTAKGIKKLMTNSKTPSHIKYLKKIGFQPKGNDIYQMDIK